MPEAPEVFTCEVRTGDGGRQVVVVTGEVDVATAPRMQEALLSMASGPGGVAVDLSGVRFIDSTGLRALMVAHTAAEGRLEIVSSNAVVDRFLDVTGLRETFGDV